MPLNTDDPELLAMMEASSRTEQAKVESKITATERRSEKRKAERAARENGHNTSQGGKVFLSRTQAYRKAKTTALRQLVAAHPKQYRKFLAAALEEQNAQ